MNWNVRQSLNHILVGIGKSELNVPCQMPSLFGDICRSSVEYLGQYYVQLPLSLGGIDPADSLLLVSMSTKSSSMAMHQWLGQLASDATELRLHLLAAPVGGRLILYYRLVMIPKERKPNDVFRQRLSSELHYSFQKVLEVIGVILHEELGSIPLLRPNLSPNPNQRNVDVRILLSVGWL